MGTHNPGFLRQNNQLDNSNMYPVTTATGDPQSDKYLIDTLVARLGGVGNGMQDPGGAGGSDLTLANIEFDLNMVRFLAALIKGFGGTYDWKTKDLGAQTPAYADWFAEFPQKIVNSITQPQFNLGQALRNLAGVVSGSTFPDTSSPSASVANLMKYSDWLPDVGYITALVVSYIYPDKITVSGSGFTSALVGQLFHLDGDNPIYAVMISEFVDSNKIKLGAPYNGVGALANARAIQEQAFELYDFDSVLVAIAKMVWLTSSGGSGGGGGGAAALRSDERHPSAIVAAVDGLITVGFLVDLSGNSITGLSFKSVGNFIDASFFLNGTKRRQIAKAASPIPEVGEWAVNISTGAFIYRVAPVGSGDDRSYSISVDGSSL